MPLYTYRCRRCGEFDAFMPLAASELPVDCEQCGLSSDRVIKATRLALLDRGARQAHETNERSAHEPRVSGRGCCSGGRCSHHGGTAADKPAPVRGSTSGARPWMLGH